MVDYDSIFLNFNYAKYGFESWYKELLEITVNYFEKSVLPLLSIYSISEAEEKYILKEGYINILNVFKSERALNTNYGLLTAQIYESLKKSPLDKTNIDIKLFGAFHGFTFMAVKNYALYKSTLHSKIENIKLNKEIELFRVKEDVYKKALEKNKTLEETSTDSMMKKLISVIADTRTIAPSFKLLSDKTGDSEYLWKFRIINDIGFLAIFKRELESKYKQAKPSKRNDNKKFWGDVWVYWYKRIDNRIKKVEDRNRDELVKNSIQKTKGKAHSFNKFKGKDYDEADYKLQKGKPTCKSCGLLEAVKKGYCEDCFDIYG